jgi:hypothetical protein
MRNLNSMKFCPGWRSLVFQQSSIFPILHLWNLKKAPYMRQVYFVSIKTIYKIYAEEDVREFKPLESLCISDAWFLTMRIVFDRINHS